MSAANPVPTSPPRRPFLLRPVAVSVVVLCGLFLALLTYGLASRGPGTTINDALAQGEPADAPGFDLPLLAEDRLDPSGGGLRGSLADGRIDIGELRGTPVVVNFWASWCPPCEDEAETLERGWKEQRGRVAFLGVNMQDVTDDARNFIRRQGLTYPNVRTPDDAIARRWGVVGLPETFFLRRDGKIVGHVIGAIDKRQLRDGIAAARSGKVAPPKRGGDSRSVQQR